MGNILNDTSKFESPDLAAMADRTFAIKTKLQNLLQVTELRAATLASI